MGLCQKQCGFRRENTRVGLKDLGSSSGSTTTFVILRVVNLEPGLSFLIYKIGLITHKLEIILSVSALAVTSSIKIG